MTIDISNNAARVNYTVASGVTQTSFSVPFEFFNDGDLSVYVDDVLKTITTHYTVSGGDGSTGTITMSVTGAAGGSTVVISRSIAIERTSDFVTGVDINRAALNTQLDTLTAIAADNQDKANRSITAPNSEVNPVLELPDADTRKGKLIGFNETTGNIELSATLADGNTLASISGDIATLADIEDGTNATDAIQTVAGISSNVTTVAGISSNVTSVAGNESNINTVAADATDIGTVASSIASVNTAAANITEIQNASANAATATTKAAEAATSASNAATSEGNASTSEANAATSASTATTQAGISTTKAAESAASAAAALDSENAAATSESNASISESNASNSATLSEASRIASVAAQAAAETAETNAETAETNAASSASAASTSASNASTSETNAATSAATATTQAGIATTKAGEAATSATSAASSASSAQASKDAALAALDSFDDRYLGQKTADPTLDNDGDALVSGALYFNTTDDIMKVYDGSLWVAAYASLSGAMFGANNLSDVADAAGSRTNLGLGTGNTPTFAGINTTGNVTFGDNDKAIFGAGSDLQIYHDGSHGIIAESGSGDLLIYGNNLRLGNADGSELYILGNNNAEVQLRYNNATKLATTSTGIDVTGTVTADGLTVDGGDIVINDSSPALFLYDTDGTNQRGLVLQSGADMSITSRNDTAMGNILLSTSDGGFTRVRLKVDGPTGDISFYEDTGTTPKFFWDASAESLGIGTSSPQRELHIHSNSSSGAQIRLQNNEGYSEINADGGALGFNISTTERMRIDSSGRVGIGTSSPSAPLSVDSTGAVIKLNQSNVAADTYIDMRASSAAFGYDSSKLAATIQAGAGNKFISFNVNNNTFGDGEAMRIDSSGNVGINTSSPASKVHINTGLYGEALRFQASSETSGYYTIGMATGAGLAFSRDGTERMRIDSSGNLLVGQSSTTIPGFLNTTAGHSLHHQGYALHSRDNAQALYVNRSGSDGIIAQFQKDGSTVGSIGVGTNDLLIGKADTQDCFLRFGTGGSAITLCDSDGLNTNDGAVDLGVSNYRFKDAHFSGTVNAANFNTTSDATLKTNVETLSGSLDAVKSLRGVSFDWLENGGSEIGVIAQEVEAVLPDVVSTNDEGIKSVKYGNMVAVLIEAIKEQQLRIEALEAKLGE